MNSTMAVTPVSSSLQAEVVKCSYTWTVENFSYWFKKPGDCLELPPFSVKVFEGRISMNTPNPKMLPSWGIYYPRFISLSLKLQSWDQDIVSGKYEFSILNIKGDIEQAFGLKTLTLVKPKLLRGSRELSLLILIDEANKAKDKLTIRCEVEVNMARKNMSQYDEAFAVKTPTRFVSELSDDLCKIFEDMTLSDVTLVADGKEIQAHKVILAARSSVFAAMFQHKMREQKSSQVDITDIDHEVLTEMLQFMYTGRAPNLDKMAGDLLAAADKYALDSLKVVCLEALYKSISVETAAETLVLADLHSAKGLKAQTIAFINNTVHTTEVMATAGWQSMIPAHPHLVAEVEQALAIKQQQYLSLISTTGEYPAHPLPVAEMAQVLAIMKQQKHFSTK